MRTLLVSALVLFSQAAFSQAWDASNSPYKLNKSFVANYEKLPAEGGVIDQRTAWPGSHWANYIGGIAHRWSAGTPENFTYKRLTLNELRTKEEHELNQLSPAEKYDIFKGDYSYSTVKRVFSQVSPRESEWHGICHGYAPAAVHHPEPQTVTLTNKDGITLKFYSSDVAGLMSYFYAKVANTRATLVGKRCYADPQNANNRSNAEKCGDINAGSFHIILANMLGLEKKSFIVDIDRYREVWNHPAVSYTTRVYGEAGPVASSTRNTVKRIHMEAIVKYASAIAPKFDPVIGTENAEYLDYTYEYYLDLNAKGEIIGGEWISEHRPDFVWNQPKSAFTGSWSTLNTIYAPVQ